MELREKIAQIIRVDRETGTGRTITAGDRADAILAIPELVEALRCRDWVHAAALQQELGKPA